MPRLKRGYISNMEKESKYGMMGPNTMEIGETEWLKAKELFTMLMETFIPVSSIKTEQMALVFMCIQMDKDMKDSGQMIIKMGLEKKS